jgi:hypothetical protein
MDETMTTHKSDLDYLLTLRFQLFEKTQAGARIFQNNAII